MQLFEMNRKSKGKKILFVCERNSAPGPFVSKYRVIFLTGPPLNLLSVGWKVTDFKNIARIANAVQVTICLLVSTSVY